MRKLLAVLMVMALLPLGAASLSGCSKAQDEVLENDPKVSDQKREEYSQKMREEMQKSIPKGKGPKR
jgi:hypothetical protein